MAGHDEPAEPVGLVAATDGTERETGLDIEAVFALEPYWEAVRQIYKPLRVRPGLPHRPGHFHEIPGGQLSNLRQQAIALGLGDRFEDVENMYAAANAILGNLVKVTPSSKVVGDLALALVGAGPTQGLRGQPHGIRHPGLGDRLPRGRTRGPARRLAGTLPHKALEGRHAKARVTELTVEQEEALRTTPQRALNQLLFPGPTSDFETSREKFGNLSVLGTIEFLHGIEPGTEYEVEIEAGKRLLRSAEHR